MDEAQKIKEAYLKRESKNKLYSPIASSTIMSEQEKFRTIARWIRRCGINPLNSRFFEIGCGGGLNIFYMLQLGFKPENISVNELIESRLEKAKALLPAAVTFLPGNAEELEIPAGSYDIIFQSMVFSSILDEKMRRNLAGKMWNWLKPGGGILWYDFIYNNPSNKDVKGIPVSEVLKLFPGSEYYKWKITLAPPLSRLVTKIHPFFYTLFNLLRFTRTHYLVYIVKPDRNH